MHTAIIMSSKTDEKYNTEGDVLKVNPNDAVKYESLLQGQENNDIPITAFQRLDKTGRPPSQVQ